MRDSKHASHLPDFDSFIAPFRKDKKDLSEAERQAFRIKKLDELKRCSRMEQLFICRINGWRAKIPIEI